MCAGEKGRRKGRGLLGNVGIDIDYVGCLLIKLMITRAAQKPKMATIIL